MPRKPAGSTVIPAHDEAAGRARKASARPAPRREKAPRRGRPPQDAATQQAVRRRLLDATGRAFTRVGYHELSVELILAEAGLSRPTFYKHFRNSDEPIRMVIREVNDDLIGRLGAAVAAAGSPGGGVGALDTSAPDAYSLVDTLLDTWRQWGTDLGPMLRPLFNELHDAHSPAAPERLRTHAILGDRLMALAAALGRPQESRLRVDALLQGVEFLGYHWQLASPRDAASWAETRDAMLRLAVALLGDTADWALLPELAARLGLDISGKNQSKRPAPHTPARKPATRRKSP